MYNILFIKDTIFSYDVYESGAWSGKTVLAFEENVNDNHFEIRYHNPDKYAYDMI